MEYEKESIVKQMNRITSSFTIFTRLLRCNAIAGDHTGIMMVIIQCYVKYTFIAITFTLRHGSLLINLDMSYLSW